MAIQNLSLYEKGINLSLLFRIHCMYKMANLGNLLLLLSLIKWCVQSIYVSFLCIWDFWSCTTWLCCLKVKVKSTQRHILAIAAGSYLRRRIGEDNGERVKRIAIDGGMGSWDENTNIRFGVLTLFFDDVRSWIRMWSNRHRTKFDLRNRPTMADMHCSG